MADSNKIALPGSERTAVPGANLAGPTDPNQLVEISVVLKQRRELKLDHLQGKVLSHDEFASTYGADPQHIERLLAFARANNLTFVKHGDEIARRTIKLQGTVANLEKAFGVTLNDYEHPTGVRFRGRTGSIHVSSELADVVQGVFGLDNRPQAKPHLRFRGLAGASDAAAQPTSYNPPQVAQLYNFPTGVNGAGQTIGIIELGGGYNPADITNYFASLGIPAPKVTSVSVDNGKNSPSTPDRADGEVLLAIEVAGSVAPCANI